MPAPHLPPEVEARWSTAWGEESVEAARRQIARRPQLDLTFADAAEAEAYAAEHDGRSLAPWNVRLESRSVADLPGFGEGRWWVQDLAASLPARLIRAEANDILDLCAAPGGKTMQLAAGGHRVTAVDASESRLERLHENLQRTRLEAKLVQADALAFDPGRQFDAIMLDAPCSATGTFRRHPEVLYRARSKVIADSAELQRQLLDRASRWLKPGRSMVYSVCSLEHEEGEHVVEDFLSANLDFKIEPPRPSELPDFLTPDEAGAIRVVPGLLEGDGGLDGFFMARLVRTR
jgi:16S rRNA (cytosine967-C5)-methyltransferase